MNLSVEFNITFKGPFKTWLDNLKLSKDVTLNGLEKQIEAEVKADPVKFFNRLENLEVKVE